MPTGVYKRTDKHYKILSKNSPFIKGHKTLVGKHWKIKDKSKMYGHTPWNKDKPSPKMIGNTNGFKKGLTPWNKGIKVPQMSGEKHFAWKGGITPENVKIRTSLEIKLWRDAIYARDGYTDQKTGIRGGKLVAHHILNFSSHPELRFAIDNGITLSEKSHKAFHRKYGIKNNTREQLEEFLSDKPVW